MKRTRHAMTRGKLALVRREEIARAIDLLRWWADVNNDSGQLRSVEETIAQSQRCAQALAQALGKGAV